MSSATAPVELHLYQLHPFQEKIRREAKRFNVVALGRRSGKTVLGHDLVVETVLERGQPFGLFAPNYPALMENWYGLKDLLRPIATRVSESEHRIDVVGGGHLDCWSLDSENVADSARGRYYGRIGVEEAGSVKGLLDHWGKVMRPMLVDLGGDAWFWGTPKGLNGFYTLYQRGQDPLDADWMSWQAPTTVNPYISRKEIEDARRDSPERVFAQEHLAEFVADGTGVFRRVLEACRAVAAPGALAGRSYVFGVDWGRANDFTVVSVLDATTREQVWLERFNQIDFHVQKGRLAILAQKFKPVLIVAEANAMGMPLVEDIGRMGLRIHAWTSSNAAKAAAIDGLALAIERGDLALLADPIQTGELLAFESGRTPTGMVTYSAPEGMHDDTVIALALAWLAACNADPGLRQHDFRMGE